MEYVQDAVYYHLQRANHEPSWRVNDTYFVGKNKNPFVGYFDIAGLCLKDANGRYGIKTVAGCMVRYIKTGEKDNRLEPFYHFDANETVQELWGALGHYLKLTREVVFEEVRREFFPHFPSRHRCIWVIPDNENIQEAVAYWSAQLGGQQKLFKVRSGKVHQTSQQYLKLTTRPLDHVRQEAFKYWAGISGTSSIEDECLFEGFVTVLEEG